MKTILHTFLLLLCLLCASSLCTHSCFANEAETAAQINNTPDKQEQKIDIIKSKTSLSQESKNQLTQQTEKKEMPFSSSQDTIPSFGWGNYFQGIGIMLLLLIVFWYILKLMRKVGNGRFLPNQKLLPRDSMYLEGQLPLGQGKSIVIVKVLDERLVLGVTEKNINLLSKTGTNHAETFEELMQQVPSKNTPHA